MRGSFALTRRIAIEVEVPFRSVKTDAAFEDQFGVIRDEFGSIHHRDETVSGIGDVSVATRIRLAARRSAAEVAPATKTETETETLAVASRPWLLDLVVGVSAPTGTTEEDPFDRGSRGLEHQHVFTGSGTWNPLLQLEYNLSGQRFDTYAWIGGSTALTENSYGYRRGFGGSSGVGLSSAFGLERVSFQGQIEVEHSEPSTWQSRSARNSGRTDLVLALGASVSVAEDLVLRGQLRFPENLRARDGNLEPSVVLLAGVSYSFMR